MDVRDKIAALKRLSENPSATPAEAASAAARIQELMLKHQLSESDVARDESEIEQDREPIWTGKRWSRWIGVLAHEVAKVNNCRAVRGRFPSSSAAQITLVGRRDDIANTRYLFTYLRREIERLARAHLGKASSLVRARNAGESYRLGFVEVVATRLHAMRAEVIQTARAEGVSSSALIRLDQRQAEIDAWVATRFAVQKQANVRLDAASWKAGARDGESLSLHRAMEVSSPA